MGWILRSTKATTITLFTVFTIILLVQSYGFSADGLSDFITEIKEFSMSDLRDDVVSFIIDGTADVTIGIYDLIMKGVHSQDVNTGMSATLDIIGFGSVESLVKGIASSVKSII